MIKRTSTNQLALCTDSTGYFCGKITNRDRVLEGTRSNLTESASSSLFVFDNSNIVTVDTKTERLLDDQHQWIGKEKEEAIDSKVVIHGAIKLREIVCLYELER